MKGLLVTLLVLLCVTLVISQDANIIAYKRYVSLVVVPKIVHSARLFPWVPNGWWGHVDSMIYPLW